MFRKSIAVAASIVLSAGLATASASAATPKVAVKAGSSCAKVGAVTTINHVKFVCIKNSRTHKQTWVKAYVARPKVAVKAGSYCAKVGTATTINRLRYVCTKNTHTRKQTWVKHVLVKKVVLSAECLSMQKANVKMQSDYDNALAQIADTQAKIAAITGPAGDSLRAQVATMKSTILILGPTVLDGQAQFKLFCS